MRIAYLNNHSTAARFFVKLFKEFNFEAFISARECGVEKNAFTGVNVLNTRNLSLSKEKIDILDSVDLTDASDKQKIKKFVSILEQDFDAIILSGHPAHAINTPVLEGVKNRPIIVLEWGDVCGVFRHAQWCKYENNSNVFFGYTFPQFSTHFKKDKSFLLPITFSEEIYKKYSKTSSGRGISIISHSEFNYGAILKCKELTENIKLPCQIRILGKNNTNLNTVLKDNRSFELLSNIDIEQVYQEISRADFFIYTVCEKTMAQYGPAEAIFLGTLAFYFKNTFFYDLINRNDWCACENYEEMNKKIVQSLSMSNDEINNLKNNQKNILNYLGYEHVKEHWSNAFKTIKAI